MKNLLWIAVVILGVGFLAACGEEEEKRTEAEASATQQQALETAMADLGQVSAVSADAQSAQSANSTLSAIFNSYNSVISEALAQEAAEGVVQLSEEMECGEGTVEWEDGSVTYTNCYGLDGTITWSGDTYTINLTYAYAEGTAGYSGSFTYDGEVTITEASIDGALHFDYQVAVGAEGMAFDYIIDMAITYDNIGLSADGCPESGELDIEADWDYNYNGESYSFDVHFTAIFNACGDTTVLY